MIFGKPFRKKWYLRLCVCLVSDSFLAWHLKITQHSQQTSKQRTFLKERVKKWQNNTFASNVYICVLVFIINQHNGWKVLIYEIQIKKVHYPSTSFLKGRRTRVTALVKSSENCFILVPVFYLIMCLMKALKNFEKIAILKIWELVSLGGGKTHFGKLALKWCIFRHEEFFF